MPASEATEEGASKANWLRQGGLRPVRSERPRELRTRGVLSRAGRSGPAGAGRSLTRAEPGPQGSLRVAADQDAPRPPQRLLELGQAARELDLMEQVVNRALQPDQHARLVTAGRLRLGLSLRTPPVTGTFSCSGIRPSIAGLAPRAPSGVGHMRPSQGPIGYRDCLMGGCAILRSSRGGPGYPGASPLFKPGERISRTRLTRILSVRRHSQFVNTASLGDAAGRGATGRHRTRRPPGVGGGVDCDVANDASSGSERSSSVRQTRGQGGRGGSSSPTPPASG